MALGVLRALNERGRQVPRDVSVVGFDDTPESGYFTPPLTTVRQDFQQVGRATVRLLLDQLATGTRKRDRVVIDPELIVRKSTI
jgi:DNA-binding LacI/PurR family transcriptional regulator